MFTIARGVCSRAPLTRPTEAFIILPHHEWGINQPLKEQSHEQTQIGADKFFAKQI
jgi:hypothetical protein